MPVLTGALNAMLRWLAAPSPTVPHEQNAPLADAGATALPFRYLIAIDDQLPGKDGEITEVGYDGPLPRNGRGVRYCNLYDQTGSGRYGPYKPSTDTASAYGEKVVDPKGAGWMKLLADQCHAAIAAGFHEIEWDNPDGYDRDAVIQAVDYAASRDLKVWAKNPLACSWDSTTYVGHSNVIGVIVERGAGNPADMDALRRRCAKPDLQVQFVAFRARGEDGKSWADATARAIRSGNFRNMGVSYSPNGEYTSVTDILLPNVGVTMPTPTPVPPAGPIMLILRGIAGTFAGKSYPRGALDEPSALEYARRSGYAGRVLDVSGETGPTSPQVLLALREFRKDTSITALYGFSGGGYNIRHILNALTMEEKARIKKIVVLGAPNNPADLYSGPWDLSYRLDPPGGHMDGPRAFLAELDVPRISSVARGRYHSLIGGFFATPDDRNLPVSIRMNNPGAVNGAAWEQQWPGYVDTTETTPGNKTTIFESPEEGVAVWWELMRKYRDAGATTVGAIINRYGGGQDYSAYVTFVLKQTGYTATKQIDLADDKALLPFAKAMFRYEAGRPTPLSDAQIVYGFGLGRSHSGNVTPPPPVAPPPVVQPPIAPAHHDFAAAVVAAMAAHGCKVDPYNIVYVAGRNPDGTKNANRKNAFDDLRMVIKVDAGAATMLGAWPATIETGVRYTQNPINPKGAARIDWGRQECWQVGIHRGSHEALVQTGGQVRVWRDANKDYSRDGDALDTGWFGINQHSTGGADAPLDDIGSHSAGCLVTPHMDWHRKFMALVKAFPDYVANKNHVFATTVMPSEWVAE